MPDGKPAPDHPGEEALAQRVKDLSRRVFGNRHSSTPMDSQIDSELMAELRSIPTVVDLVIEQIRGGTRAEQMYGTTLLHELCHDPTMVIAVLEQALIKGEETTGPSTVLTQLGFIAIPALLRATQSDNRDGRCAAISALGDVLWGWMGNSAITEAVTRAFRDDDESMREAAQFFVSQMESFRFNLLTTILTSINSSGENQRDHVSQAIQDMAAPYCVSVLNNALASRDLCVRKVAAIHLAGSIAMSQDSVAQLGVAAVSDPSDDVRMSALLTLEQIGLQASEGLATVMESLAQAQHSQTHSEVRTRSLLVQERIRDAVRPFANIPRARLKIAPASANSRSIRPANAPSMALLALLNTLIKWGDEPISRSKLAESLSLGEEREAMGLAPFTNRTTIGYQLSFLAELCGEPSVLIVYNKRQASQFRPGIKAKLQVIQEHLAPFILRGSTLEEIAGLNASRLRTP
jgi:hypothetical protein